MKIMKKTLKIVVILLLSSIFLIFSFGCLYLGYHGENPELYTMAVHNLVGSKGYITDGEPIWDPEIEILETDDYGRVLFIYDESRYQKEFGAALMVMQKIEDGYVYYYEDYCYIKKEVSHELEYTEWFLDEEIDQLKQENNWDKEIQDEKCEKREISNKKPHKGNLQPSFSTFDKLVKAYFKSLDYEFEDAGFRYETYCTSDRYGRALYYVCGDGIVSSEYQYHDFAIIFNPDGTCNQEIGIVEIDLANCRESIIALKILNGWNTPYES